MDYKREHRTPPTSKGHGRGYTTTTTSTFEERERDKSNGEMDVESYV